MTRSPEAVATEPSPRAPVGAVAQPWDLIRAARSQAGTGRRSRFDEAEDDERGGGFELGWTASALLNLLLLSGPVGLVIALPPVLDCRERAERFGFFAGDSYGKCTERGIDERLGRLDARLKILVRGSGR